MKSLMMCAALAVAASAVLPARAALTVTATNGVESLTLAFDAAADARELWVAWDAADKGAGFADWAESERVAIVAADETTLTVALPNDARRADYARFFLFAGGASYPCAFIRSSNQAYINTGYFVGPNSAVSVDYVMEDVVTLQQRPFGASGSTFVISAYINSAASWSWAFTDGATGNWTNTNLDFQKRRTIFTIDGPNDRISLAYDGVEAYSGSMSAAVPLEKRTQTCDVPLSLCANGNTTGASDFATMRLYGATIDEAGVRQHTFAPYVSAGVAGVYDSTADAFFGNAGTGAFTPCGRGGDVSGAEAGEALDLDAVRGGPAEPETVYVNVGKGKTVTFDGPATIDYRLVKIGEGTLVLEGTRTFNGNVIISNGILRANWATSGLAGTHLGICNHGGNSNLCYFQETSDSFTAPVAASGPGTVELYGYSGVIPFRQDLTVNFGGDGRTVTRGVNGFNTTSFWLTHDSSTNSTTFLNNIDFAGLNLESKGSGSGTAFYTGYITNSTSTSAGVWNFWGGKQVLVGTRGTANERVDFFGYRISNNAATLIFSNAVIRTSNDFIGGSAYNHLCHTTLVNCDKNSTGGWDYGGAGYTNTTFTIIGGTFARSSGNLVCGYTGSRVGTCVVTNGATVTAPTFWTYPGGVYRQYDGTSTFNNLQQFGGLVEMRGGQMNLKSGEQHVGTSGPLGPSAFAMYGGTVYVSDGQNMQIGSYSKGWFHQEGGEVSVPNYFAVGRYAAGVGLLDVHGGTFTHRNQNYLRIAEDGTGTVSVANGGTFVDLAAYSPISQNAAGKGTAILSPDGTFETPQFRAGAAGRNSSVVFNGGTMKLRTNGYPTSFLDSTISRVTVSPYGGAIDTNGKGDFTLNRALGPTTDAGDLSEALAHRWSFKNGSLVDSVGGLTATVGGTVDLEDGAVRLKGTARGTSCVNLGTTLLPTDGRGATIEVWVTPLSFKSWARVVDFGTGSEGAGKDFYFSFNDGNNNATARTHFRTINADLNCYISTALSPNRTYHLALVFAPQPNRKMLCTAYIRDANTGELLNTGSGTQALDWTLGDIPQENGCWLGHSSYASNNDPDARYHEVRIHHRPMSAAQTEASCLAGPDAVYYFRKKGAGTLTMTGANTYTVGTAVDAGTLKLASGATLPATEMWAGADATLDLNGTAQTARELGGTGTVKGGTLAVTETIQPGGRKAVGTLTVDGTTLTSGTLVVDLDANGASDCLAATGALDLSNLSLALGDATALDETKVYTIATATGVTGTFAHADIPKKWRVSVLGSQVKLGYANGTVLFFR